MTVDTIVLILVGTILSIAALGAIYRILLGPTLLDRLLGTDVLLVIFSIALATDMVINRHSDSWPLLAGIALIGFLGSVTVARYVEGRKNLGSSHVG